MIPEPPSLRPGPSRGNQEQAEEILFRFHFFKLSEYPQRLITLHLLARLSVREISSCLGRPRSAIKRDLKGAMKTLRDALELDGLKSADPWLTPEWFEKAICKETELPAGLLTRILKRIDDVEGSRFGGGQPSTVSAAPRGSCCSAWLLSFSSKFRFR